MTFSAMRRTVGAALVILCCLVLASWLRPQHLQYQRVQISPPVTRPTALLEPVMSVHKHLPGHEHFNYTAFVDRCLSTFTPANPTSL